MVKEPYTKEYLARLREENPALYNLLQLASTLSEEELNNFVDFVTAYKNTL